MFSAAEKSFSSWTLTPNPCRKSYVRACMPYLMLAGTGHGKALRPEEVLLVPGEGGRIRRGRYPVRRGRQGDVFIWTHFRERERDQNMVFNLLRYHHRDK